ncbi:MAG: DNA polymerase III subunit gamma/tau [Saprospiraceae bacterium]|nr:DNA polymerase III subunit gamma/tau [Saprospiraceae bacterium]MBK8297327.1 DNA polymerase III subunit gamma/tau [Saprospiraceae bacterium]
MPTTKLMDSFIVSARKYRPLKWTDVIGQEHVAHTLKNALAKGQIAHAFLFCGPRGVGKTTCARILAKVLNCTNPSADWEPCNSCDNCRAFMENASFNIFELDAASNNSVEDIRELVDQVRYQPQAGKYKIYIVDEVHMLSTAAFNAFLKTLEEPPPYAKFILATTEKHKIIPTILSRCQIYDFRRIQEKDIVFQLEKICQQESIQAEDEALHLIAQKADGALRDALSIFDRIKSFSDKSILYKDVVENLNVLDYDYFFKFSDAFLTENVEAALVLLDQVLSLGFDPEIILEGMASHFRNLMIVKDPNLQSLFEGSDAIRKKYIQQAEACRLSDLINWLDQVHESDVNLVRSRNKRLHIEILLIKICYASRKKMDQVLSDPSPTENISTPLASNPGKTEKKESETSPVVKKVNIAASQIMKDAFMIPKLGNLDSLKQKIEADEKQKQEKLIDFTEENFLQFWEDCKRDEKSASFKVMLNSTKVKWEPHSITILTGSGIVRDSIRMELKLDEKIRNTFSTKNITSRIEIDPELAALEEKKIVKKLSANEKWDMMLASNQKLSDLKDVFSLKMDED